MLAAQHVREKRLKSARELTRLVRTLAQLKGRMRQTSQAICSSTVVSANLINLAVDDARASRDELLRLFSPDESNLLGFLLSLTLRLVDMPDLIA